MTTVTFTLDETHASPPVGWCVTVFRPGWYALVVQRPPQSPPAQTPPTIGRS